MEKMDICKTISCYLIGEDKLVIQCGERLLAKNHRILGIISLIPAIQSWATQHSIPYFTSLVEFKTLNLEKPCDYLFSLVNYQILPPWALALPNYCAINYHDSLLPQYAGIHSTSWALINQEKTHGITWHVINEGLDAGDILKQAMTPINQDETALSLNLKCYNLAISTFSALIDELATHAYQRTAQNLAQRSYFGRYTKPPVNGWIDWRQPAERIDNLCRALQFGSTINRLATPKFAVGNEVFVIDKQALSERLSTAEPGTIVAINSQAIRIATQTFDLDISRCRTLDNGAYTPLELDHQYQLKIGDKLKEMSPQEQLFLEQYGQEQSVHEAFWVHELERLNPINIPFLNPHLTKELSPDYTLFAQFKIKQTSWRQLTQHHPSLKKDVFFLTLLLVYLYRLNGQENFSIGYNIHSPMPDNSLSAHQLPLNVEFKDHLSFELCLKQIQAQLLEFFNKKTFSKDVYCRYPSLAQTPGLLSLSITLIENIADYDFNHANHLIFVIETSKSTFHLFVNKSLQITSNLATVLRNSSGHLKNLNAQLAAHYNQSISKLTILTKKESNKILKEWIKTDTDFCQNKGVHQLFEEQVSKTPNKKAITFENSSLSFLELNQKSNQLAHYLRSKGVKRQHIVAICLPRGLNLVISLLGVLKAGAAYVPLDPEYPDERIQFIINDSEAKLIITHSNNKSAPLFAPKTTVIIDQEWPLIKEKSIDNLITENQPNDLIYLIYTSGSTGKPKGVLVEHKGVVNCLISIAQKIKINANDKFLAVTPLSFDVAALDYYLPFAFGASTIIASDKDRKNGEALIHLLCSAGITAMQATPTTWQMLIIGQWEGAKQFKILTAGEALSKNLSNSLQQRGLLFNIYGPTETTIYATFAQIKKNSPLSIGKPIANTKAFVLNNSKIPQPIGVRGELYISGIGVTRGYLHHEEGTKNNFINKLSVGNDTIRAYKTGDLVRWLPDGNLEYINRIDHQIKIRGYRIELGEIEHRLLDCPDIRQAVVLPYENKEHKQLVAYIVRNDNLQALNKEQLKKQLAQQLPEFMIPTLYVELTAIPLSSSGKLQRNALLQMYPPTRNKNKSEITLPSTTIEMKLCHIWEACFGIKPIAINDNFFHLGGDSIIAMQIVSKGRQYNIHLTVKQIFLHPTIKELAVSLDQTILVAKKKQVDIQLNVKFPLASIQSWFFSEQFQKQEQWGQSCLIDIAQDIDQDILILCLQQLLVEHDALRIHFEKQNNGLWQQFYTNDSSMPFYIEKLPSSISKEQWSQHLRDWELRILGMLNFKQSPLIGGTLFKIDNKPKKLLMVAHHLIVDGVSWRILCHDLYNLYQQRIKGQSLTLPNKTASYKSWVSEVLLYINSTLTKEDKEYWLESPKVSTLPKDFDETDNFEKDAKIYTANLTSKETQLLLKQPVFDFSAKITTILLAVLARTLENWTCNRNMQIDMESHGRSGLEERLDISHTVGWFTSIYPFYLTWPTGSTLKDLIELVTKQLSLIRDNGIIYGALRYLKTYKKMGEILKKQQKSEIIFNYWGQFNTQLENDIFHLNSIHLLSAQENKRPYIIDISCWIAYKKFYISFSYNQKYHKYKTIKLLANNYIELLKNFIEETHIKQLPTPSINNLIEATYPLTSLQKGLLFHFIHSPTSGSYIVQSAWKSSKGFNLCLNTLRKTWQFLVARHQALRTYFIWENLQEPSQVIQKTAEFSWNFYDWQKTEIGQVTNRLNQFLKADLQAAFDFSKLSLLRVTVIRLPQHQYHIIITVPHIILDGWSLAILFKELNICYQAIINNNIPSLPPAIPYSRFIEWQNKKNQYSTQQFWQGYLKDFLTPTDLPFNDNGHALNNTEPEMEINEFTLPPELTQKARKFCRQNKLTVNTLFQGLWGLLLHYYSQNNDIVFGVTLTERNPHIKDSAQIVGLLINTLPLRIHFKKEIFAGEYLNEIQNNFLKIANHHHTPLIKIQEWSEITNGASLFQTLLVFENYPNRENETQFFKFNEINIVDPTHYPLTCIVYPNFNIKIRLSFDKHRISYDFITRLQGHLQTILTALIDYPQRSISSISPLTLNEKKQILTDWNTTKAIYPHNKTVHQLFEEQVARTPNKVALVFENQEVTYSELNNLANQMANFLLGNNIQNSDLVGICMDRCIEVIIAILGILKIGGVYIPIDPRYPAKRIQIILKDAKPATIITKKSIYQKIDLLDTQILDFESLEIISHFSMRAPKSVVTANALAYIIYTSGSTGKPKGVLIEHQALVNFLSAMRLYIKPTSEDNILALTSLAFDISGLELYLPLIVGAKCVIANQNTAANGNKLKKLIRKNQISILQATPITWKFLLESEWENKSVKQILCGGEALPNTLAIQLLKKADKVWNLYGPTETTIWSTINLVTTVPKNQGVVSIGKPIINTQLYVLNNHLQPLPIGIVGELYIGGDGLARGYLNSPIMTKRKFIPNLFSKNPKDRLYRTGDLVRWLPDGNLEYIQRIDDQIKINGFRIELSEIEAQLREHPAIEQAIAIIQGKTLGKQYITAFVRLKSKLILSPKILRNFMQKRLPSYMIPTFFIILDIFPITPNGKIDKKALSILRLDNQIEENNLFFFTKKEKILAAIWQEILEVNQVSKEDSFFELGGHSLSALQMLTKINQQFHIDLSVRTLFDNPTIEQLSQTIQLLKSEKAALLAATNKNKAQIRDNCLITLQAKGDRTPLFLIHPIGGTVFWYVPLVKYFNPHRPVYGIQDLGIETGEIPFTSVSQMANFYIKVIQKVQPSGPYYIGGASAGANISVEIAYQLSQINETAQFIGLLDGWAYYPQSLQEQELFEAIMRKQHNAMHNMLSAKGIDGEFLLKLQWARSRINNEFIPPYLPNQLTLFKANKLLSIFEPIENSFNHWERYSAKPIDVYNVPGDHESMFQEPNVAILGEKLNECLNQLDLLNH